MEWFTAKPGEAGGGLQDPLMWEDETGGSFSNNQPYTSGEPFMDIRPGGKERRQGFVFWGSMLVHGLLVMMGVASLVAQFVN